MSSVSWVLVVGSHYLQIWPSHAVPVGTQFLWLWPVWCLQEVCEQLLEECVAQAVCGTAGAQGREGRGKVVPPPGDAATQICLVSWEEPVSALSSGLCQVLTLPTHGQVSKVRQLYFLLPVLSSSVWVYINKCTVNLRCTAAVRSLVSSWAVRAGRLWWGTAWGRAAVLAEELPLQRDAWTQHWPLTA